LSAFPSQTVPFLIKHSSYFPAPYVMKLSQIRDGVTLGPRARRVQLHPPRRSPLVAAAAGVRMARQVRCIFTYRPARQRKEPDSNFAGGRVDCGNQPDIRKTCSCDVTLKLRATLISRFARRNAPRARARWLMPLHRMPLGAFTPTCEMK